MPCSSPVTISRWTFDRNHGGRIKRYFLVPCGHCLGCLKTRQQQIAFRAEYEAIDPSNVQTLFVTLTYANEYLPKGNELSKSAFQRFIRRLKKRIPNVRVRYVACGEYGALYGRCHYHCLLFFSDYVEYSVIKDAWPFGIVDIAPFLSARAGYVAKYSVKQIGDVSEHIQEPFILISHNVGFYFLDLHGDYCRKNYVSTWENFSGYPVYLPRIFIERLFPPRDKAHWTKSLDSPAADAYYSAFVGDVTTYRLKRKCGYDKFLESKSFLSGYLNPLLYEERLRIGYNNKEVNQIYKLISKSAYETGRY